MSFYIPTFPTEKPCEECGKTPAWEYRMVGITGVLCGDCLKSEIDNVNSALSKPPELKTFGGKPVEELTSDDIPW